jgi:hypothetical protein
MFAQNATVYELEEYTKTRPKCSICRQLNTFSCEHRTPVRDSLIKIYNDEGRFYFEPKSTFISSKSLSSTTNTTNTTNTTTTTTAASTFVRQDLNNESNQTNKLSFRSESIADRSLRNKLIISEKNNNTNLKNIQVSNNLKSNNNNNHKNNDLTKTESKPSGGCCLIM